MLTREGPWNGMAVAERLNLGLVDWCILIGCLGEIRGGDTVLYR